MSHHEDGVIAQSKRSEPKSASSFAKSYFHEWATSATSLLDKRKTKANFIKQSKKSGGSLGFLPHKLEISSPLPESFQHVGGITSNNYNSRSMSDSNLTSEDVFRHSRENDLNYNLFKAMNIKNNMYEELQQEANKPEKKANKSKGKSKDNLQDEILPEDAMMNILKGNPSGTSNSNIKKEVAAPASKTKNKLKMERIDFRKLVKFSHNSLKPTKVDSSPSSQEIKKLKKFLKKDLSTSINDSDKLKSSKNSSSSPRQIKEPEIPDLKIYESPPKPGTFWYERRPLYERTPKSSDSVDNSTVDHKPRLVEMIPKSRGRSHSAGPAGEKVTKTKNLESKFQNRSVESVPNANNSVTHSPKHVCHSESNNQSPTEVERIEDTPTQQVTAPRNGHEHKSGKDDFLMPKNDLEKQPNLEEHKINDPLVRSKSIQLPIEVKVHQHASRSTSELRQPKFEDFVNPTFGSNMDYIDEVTPIIAEHLNKHNQMLTKEIGIDIPKLQGQIDKTALETRSSNVSVATDESGFSTVSSFPKISEYVQSIDVLSKNLDNISNISVNQTYDKEINNINLKVDSDSGAGINDRQKQPSVHLSKMSNIEIEKLSNAGRSFGAIPSRNVGPPLPAPIPKNAGPHILNYSSRNGKPPLPYPTINKQPLYSSYEGLYSVPNRQTYTINRSTPYRNAYNTMEPIYSKAQQSHNLSLSNYPTYDRYVRNYQTGELTPYLKKENNLDDKDMARKAVRFWVKERLLHTPPETKSIYMKRNVMPPPPPCPPEPYQILRTRNRLAPYGPQEAQFKCTEGNKGGRAQGQYVSVIQEEKECVACTDYYSNQSENNCEICNYNRELAKTKSSSDSDHSVTGGLRTASLDRLGGRRGPPHQNAHVHHVHNPHYTLPRRPPTGQSPSRYLQSAHSQHHHHHKVAAIDISSV